MTAPTPWPIVDTPNNRGMFMLGTTVLFQGIASAAVPLQVGPSFWYSTGNMLNSTDPCQDGMPMQDRAKPSCKSA